MENTLEARLMSTDYKVAHFNKTQGLGYNRPTQTLGMHMIALLTLQNSVHYFLAILTVLRIHLKINKYINQFKSNK